MTSGILSRWPVVVAAAVVPADYDEDGRLTESTVERLFADARAAYFARCRTVDQSILELQSTTVRRGRATVDANGVTISVGVIEVFPDRFVMMARLRPVGPADGDGIAATAWCSLSARGQVPTAMQDEFIALAHAATHMH